MGSNPILSATISWERVFPGDFLHLRRFFERSNRRLRSCKARLVARNWILCEDGGSKERGNPEMTLGERIQQLRKGAGLSQEQLAEALKVSRQAVSKWETDQSMPDVEKLLALSALLGVTTDELLGRSAARAAAEEKEAPGAEVLVRGNLYRRCLTVGAVMAGGAAALLAGELLALLPIRDAAVRLAVEIGDGFRQDAMWYAKQMPMPAVFALTAALLLAGAGLCAYGVYKGEKMRRKKK
jgi:transcriptional regulator with XRE-family HTH domain